MEDLFKPVYGPACKRWYAGIDTDKWPDTRREEKRFDALIYDKIRWNRDQYTRELTVPILDLLKARGLSHCLIRYGQYQHDAYRRYLRQSRAMIFLCEHETQGLAYQEALASNLPVLAWDNGYWLDPRRPALDPNPVPTTSVPYFSPECGERFRCAPDLADVFDRFWNQLPVYEPRKYVQRELSLEGSAGLYLQHYRRATSVIEGMPTS
jgi:glycosyltransferase involved in cell wall biosynthesis